jgi:hypothetical protein
MHLLVARHGQPGWVAALTPLSVAGMIVAASTTLLADSRSGRNGGVLPWALLVAGSVASLAANVAVAEPSLIGRVIAAWPSFALTASYELLTRQVRRGAAQPDIGDKQSQRRRTVPVPVARRVSATGLRLVPPPELGKGGGRPSGELQRRAWEWAQANRAADGGLPSGSAIALAHERKERWGRLVKSAGQTGMFGPGAPAGTGTPGEDAEVAVAAGPEGAR